MDSLLVVLVVIGVVMILAGIARMRSNKKNKNWDDIDHNVLFSKSGEETVTPDKTPVVSKDKNPIEHFSAVEPRVDKSVQINLDKDERELHEPVAAPQLQERASSILNKIKGEPAKPEEPVELPIARAYSKEAPDRVIAINVMAHEGLSFDGERLVAAIEGTGMCFGEMDIFHFQEAGSSQFSLVNMVKPGVFKLNELEGMRTPGVSLFFQLPTQESNGMDVFERMLETAHKLADALDGELRDETRSVLTLSAIDLQKQKIAEYNLKWLLSA